MFKSRQVLRVLFFFNAYFEFHHKIARLNKTKEVSPCLWTIFKKPFLIQYNGACDTFKGQIYWIRPHAGPDIFPPHHFYNLE